VPASVPTGADGGISDPVELASTETASTTSARSGIRNENRWRYAASKRTAISAGVPNSMISAESVPS
jgi:hypothetical protein